MKFLLGQLILMSLFLLQNVYSQFTNFRLFPSSNNQIEPSITRNPLNEQILFASAFTITPSGVPSEGVYVSTNGGLNWTGTDMNNGFPPQNHGGDPGPIIDKDGVFLITHIGYVQSGMYANFSTNLGTNWSDNRAIVYGIDVDKGSPLTDNAPASPYYGRTYLAFTVFSPPFRIVISYTTNNGANWSNTINVNNSCGGNHSLGPSIAVTPAGTVFVVWASSIPIFPFTEDKIGIAKSTNGGVSWSVNECAIECNGIRTTTFSPWSVRANSNPVIDIDKTGGVRNGWIYLVTTNKNLAPAGSDPDIIMHRSTDNGNTWSSGIRVNKDAVNNGRNQFFPAIRVDENGGLNIVYFDNRNVLDSVDVYLSRSDDGGFSWSDYRISERRFYPTSISGFGLGNMGDNIGLTSGNGYLYPVWMSKIGTSNYQVWSARINYTNIGIRSISSEIPQRFGLHQNYPNPFNPLTKIRFQIAKTVNARISIFDLNGREIAVPVDQLLNPGTFEVDFDGSELASGIYYYRLVAGKFQTSRKMILIK